MRKFLALLPVVALMATTALRAQPASEFRGAWIATVANLDWPKSRLDNVAKQQADLIAELDGLKAAGINAVFFQVRTEADALYDSPYEPWSYYLTGEEGRAPNPYWDPLAFAVREAHARGMELHAWLNPYRVDRVPGLYTRDETHVTNTNPEWVMHAVSASSSIKIVDPGIPAVRQRIVDVVADIVNRYDVDGVHFDDYFYPYPPNDMSVGGPRDGLDQATFATYGAGMSKANWRRDNINRMIAAVYDTIQHLKPHVKFGVSPFGIHKNGVPSGIVGMDAYNVIYADPIQWMEAEKVDYLVPQLYWRFGGNQDYAKLAPWWRQQTTAHDRHLYPGLAAHQLGGSWALTDITSQVDWNRADADIHGTVFFRSNFVVNNTKGLRTALSQTYFTRPALTPTADWLPMVTPGTPPQVNMERLNQVVTLSWAKPSYAGSATDTTLMYLVYRVSATQAPTPEEAVAVVGNRLALTGNRSFQTTLDGTATHNHFYLTTVARNGVESAPIGPFTVTTSTSTEDRGLKAEGGIALDAAYPNPFNPSTVIGYRLAEIGQTRLTVYDLLGREVAVLVDGVMPAGDHSVTFNAAGLPSGMYLIRLQADGRLLTQTVTLLK